MGALKFKARSATKSPAFSSKPDLSPCSPEGEVVFHEQKFTVEENRSVPEREPGSSYESRTSFSRGGDARKQPGRKQIRYARSGSGLPGRRTGSPGERDH